MWRSSRAAAHFSSKNWPEGPSARRTHRCSRCMRRCSHTCKSSTLAPEACWRCWRSRVDRLPCSSRSRPPARGIKTSMRCMPNASCGAATAVARSASSVITTGSAKASCTRSRPSGSARCTRACSLRCERSRMPRSSTLRSMRRARAIWRRLHSTRRRLQRVRVRRWPSIRRRSSMPAPSNSANTVRSSDANCKRSWARRWPMRDAARKRRACMSMRRGEGATDPPWTSNAWRSNSYS